MGTWGLARLIGVLTLAVLCVGAASSSANAKPRGSHHGVRIYSHERKAERAVALARDAMARNDLAAALMGVWIGDRRVVTGALGESMTSLPATTDMHFRIGSVAISMLDTLLLQLAERGRLSLDDKLSKWFPELPQADRITLEMLANSSSGYADYVPDPSFLDAFHEDPFRHWTPEELIEIGTSHPHLYPPGTGWNYAHTNFVILGEVLRRVTGKSVGRLLRRRILDPLRLDDTNSSRSAAIPSPVLHAFSSERGTYEESTFWNPSWSLARGAVMTSTIRDLGSWARALGGGELLSRSSRRRMFSPSTVGLAGNTRAFYYALGVVIDGAWILQNPFFGGYNAVMAYLPSRKLTIVIANTVGPGGSPDTRYSEDLFREVATSLAPDAPLPPAP